MTDYHFLLVNSEALPPVFKNVVLVKELLARGEAANVSEAIRKAGISRSAYYKYKDCVFRYTGESDKNTLNLSVVLSDHAGKLSALTALLYELGANILTVNQGMPVDGAAVVSITLRTDSVALPDSQIIEKIKGIDGVISAKSL